MIPTSSFYSVNERFLQPHRKHDLKSSGTEFSLHYVAESFQPLAPVMNVSVDVDASFTSGHVEQALQGALLFHVNMAVNTDLPVVI